MCLSFYSERGVNYPTLICTACGEPIKDARKAIMAVNVDMSDLKSPCMPKGIRAPRYKGI